MRSLLSLLALGALLTTGCSVTAIAPKTKTAAPVATPAANAKPLSGRIHGGQQPINGAQVYMFAVNTTVYGANSVPLLNNSGPDIMTGGVYGSYVTTDTNGNFTITAADYTCSSQQVYLYSLGGSPGIGNQANSGIGLMAVLGPCQADGSFPGLPFVQMNEATTVAAAYALAGFAVDATDISGSNSVLASTGIANAAATAGNLVSLASGQPLANTAFGNGDGVVPQTEINTLADILAACVNSTDSSYGGPSDACTTLFYNATPNGMQGVNEPTDTATAAINIAHNPGANVGNLYGLATATAPFQNILPGAPNDWTILITYTGNGLSYTDGIATDSNGNVWVTDAMDPINFGACSTPGTEACGAVSAFSSLGAPLNGSPFVGGGLYFPQGIAIDINGNAWIANNGNETISEFTSAGSPSMNSPISVSGGNMCNAIQTAVDGYNDIWLIDGCQLTEFDSSGNQLFQSYATFLNGGNGLAVDQLDNLWVSNQGSVLGEYVYSFNDNNWTAANDGGFSGGGLQNPQSVAPDASGNIWVPNRQGAYDLSEYITNQATPGFASTPFTGAGQGFNSLAVAVDGTGNVWIANSGYCGMTDNTGGPISEYANTGAPISGPNGYQRNCVSQIGPTNLAIDLSGNLWMAGNVGDGLGELVGAASPTATPFSLAISFDQLAQEP